MNEKYPIKQGDQTQKGKNPRSFSYADSRLLIRSRLFMRTLPIGVNMGMGYETRKESLRRGRDAGQGQQGT